MPKATFIESTIYIHIPWFPVGSRGDVIDCACRRVALRFPSNTTSTGCPIMFYSWKADMVIHPKKNLCWWIATHSPHANAGNGKRYNADSKRLRDGFVSHLIPLCLPYIPQMRRTEFKCGFHRQNRAYFPRIYLWILDEHGSISFKQRLPPEFHRGKL